MSERRNIVLITLESVRADHCNFMGYKRETTPNIDRMAERGLYFTNAIAPGGGTPSSLVGAFTGDFSLTDPECFSPQKWKRELSNRKTLAEVLSKIGYDTIGVTPQAFVSRYFGFNKGFKYYFDFFELEKKHLRFRSSKTVLAEKWHRKIGNMIFIASKFITSKEPSRALKYVLWEDYYNTIIKSVNEANKPFFLWVFPHDTHLLYIPPKDNRRWSNLSDLLRVTPYLIWKFWIRGETEFTLSESSKNGLINLYDDEINYVDRLIGNLEKDLRDYDPIFVIHADHGDGFGEHGFYGHPQKLYEELIHVPLVIYNADIKGKIENPVSLLGLAPTILKLIGEENEFPSESFLHEGKDWVISKVFEGEKRKVAVRTKDWKFITGQKEEDELYYLKKDPHEQENVINEYPELAKEMRRIVEIHVKHEIERRRIYERISRIKL